MPGWSRVVQAAAASQLLTLAAFSMAVPFLPLFVVSLGVTDPATASLWAGMLTGVSATTMSIFAPIWGALADRFGRKLMLVRSMVVGSVLVGTMGLVENEWQLLILRILQGAFTGSLGAASALVAAAAPASHAGHAIGMINMAFQLGNSVGPLTGGLLVESLGFRLTFAISGVLLGIAGVVAIVWTKEPPRPTPRQSRPTASGTSEEDAWFVRPLKPFTWPSMRRLLQMQIGTQFVYSSTFALLPLYLQQMSRPAWLSPELGAGLAITLSSVTAAALMPFVGRLTDRVGYRAVLIPSLIANGCVFVPQGLIQDATVFLALRVLMGAALAGTLASLGVWTKFATPLGKEGAAFGAATAAQAMGWGVGPMVGALFAAWLGIPALFLLSAGLVFALLGLTLDDRSSGL